MIACTLYKFCWAGAHFQRNTPIGALHRLLWIYLPRNLLALDQRVTNGRVYALSSRFIRHLMNDRHPTVLVSPPLFGLVSPKILLEYAVDFHSS